MTFRVRHLGLLALATGMTAGCDAIFGLNDYEVGAAGSGGTVTGSTSSGTGTGTGGNQGGGGSSGCQGPEECPGTDTTCHFRTCEVGTCGFDDAAVDTACTEDGGAVCDGAGSCVECTDSSNSCTGEDVCINHLCVPPGCTDNEQDGDETDVDCGGTECPPCELTEGCLLPQDCTTLYCDTSQHCGACSGDDHCTAAGDYWCDTDHGGNCVPQLDAGEICKGDNQCLSGHCPADDGVCCNDACDALCVACLQSKTGLANGTCGSVTASTNPDGECDQGRGPCESSGACDGNSSSPACILNAVAAPVIELCSMTTEQCQLRVTTSAATTCADICGGFGTDCASYFNDTPNGTCGLSTENLGCANTTPYSSAICTCSRGCGADPPCPSPQICVGGTCN